MYVTYKITNLVTQEYYIGSHKTNNPYDSYMGSGVKIKHSIDIYGLENHRKDILSIFESREESLELEHKLVKEAKDSGDLLLLNITNGGLSFDYINQNLIFDRKAFGRMASHEHSRREKEARKRTYLDNPVYCRNCGQIIPYDKKSSNKFCNQSCSASYNNRMRTKNKRIATCLECGKEFISSRSKAKFCSSACCGKFKSKNNSSTSELKKKVLNDLDTIIERHKTESYKLIALDYGCSINYIKDACLGKLK